MTTSTEPGCAISRRSAGTSPAYEAEYRSDAGRDRARRAPRDRRDPRRRPRRSAAALPTRRARSTVHPGPGTPTPAADRACPPGVARERPRRSANCGAAGPGGAVGLRRVETRRHRFREQRPDRRATRRGRSGRSGGRRGTATSPTLMSRAMGAIAAGSRTPSWRRRSSAFSRSAEAGDPHGISSRATYGRSMSPGVIGSTVLPQRYDAKSAPGSSSTRVSCAPALESGDRGGPVRAGCPRRAGGSCRRTVPSTDARQVHEQRARPRAWRARHPAIRTRRALPTPWRRALTPRPSSTASASTTSGTARAGAAQREPEARRRRERLEEPTEDRRVVVRVRADRDDDPERADEHEERAVPPPHERGRERARAAGARS